MDNSFITMQIAQAKAHLEKQISSLNKTCMYLVRGRELTLKLKNIDLNL